MSAIRDGRMPVELDRTRHILFSLNVIDEVEDKIGNIEELAEAMQKKGRMKLIRWLFTALLNEGKDESEDDLTEEQVGKLIHGGNFVEIQQTILRAFRKSNTGSEDPPEINTDGETDGSGHDTENENEGNAQLGGES